MSSASAKRAKIHSPVRMKLRKSVAFWSVIAIGGLIPAIADAAQAVKAQDSPSLAGYLNADQAQTLIPDLHIEKTQIDSNKSAVLRGTIPAKCAGMIKVESLYTSRNGSTESAGFVLTDKGGFVSCVNQENSAGNSCDKPNVVCSYLSTVGSGSAIPLPANETVNVSYLNKINKDGSNGWSSVSLGGQPFVSLSAADQSALDTAAAAKAEAAREAALQQQFLHCAQSPDEANEVLSDIQNSGLPQDEIDKITTIASNTIQNETCDKVKSFESDGTQAIRALKDGKANSADDIEDGIFDLHSSLMDDNSQVKDSAACSGSRLTINARLAQVVYNMAVARAQSDNATNADIDKAEASLNRALDSSDGLNLGEKSREVFEQALNVGLPENRFRLAYQSCDQATDDYQVGEMEIQKASQTPYTNGYMVMKAENSLYQTGKGATKACKVANSMYDKMMKELKHELKDNRCGDTDSSSVSFDLFHGDSSNSNKSHANGSVCDQLAQEAKDLQDIEQNVQLDDTQQVADNLGQSQLSTGLLGGMGGLSAGLGNSFGSLSIPQNTSWGQPSPFGMSGFGGSQFGGSPMMGTMPGAYPMQMPMAGMMRPSYGSQFSGLYFQQPTMGMGFI